MLESCGLMIVFFEKAMITGPPLQNKLRTYRKGRKKKPELFSVSRAWTPPPPQYRQTRRKFLDPRMDIHYRGGRETISLLRTFYVSSNQSPDGRRCLHLRTTRYVKKLNLNFKVTSLLPKLSKYCVEIRRYLR